jgi:hypothetical protein
MIQYIQLVVHSNRFDAYLLDVLKKSGGTKVTVLLVLLELKPLNTWA